MSERPDIIKIGGYADGNYTCLCSSCDNEFIGDKRSISCLPCAALLADAEITRLRTALATARNDALEEAAQECEALEKVLNPSQVITGRCAAAIRSRITKPAEEKQT